MAFKTIIYYKHVKKVDFLNLHGQYKTSEVVSETMMGLTVTVSWILDVVIVSFEYISHLFVVFLLLTLGK